MGVGVRRGELDQTKLRPVGPLAQKLGIDRDVWSTGKALAQIGKGAGR